MPVNWEKKRAKNGVGDFNFDDVDLTLFRDEKTMMKIKYWITRAQAFKIIIDYGTDIWLTIAVAEQDIFLGILYIFFVLASIILKVFDIKAAKVVIKSDDISDNFINKEAFRYQTIKSYDRFCLMNMIKKKRSRNDKMLFAAYFSANTWKRLLFVAVPQLVIAITFTVNSGQAIEENPSIIAKIITMYMSIYKLFILIIVYPCLKCYAGSVSNMASYRIDKHLTNAIAEVTDIEAVKAHHKEFHGDAEAAKVSVAVAGAEESEVVAADAAAEGRTDVTVTSAMP